MKPYFTDGTVELYHGDFREVVPDLQYAFDLVIADPPYGETSHDWDIWPTGWPAFIADYTQAMWCFGSFRTLTDHAVEIWPYWNLSQDFVWEKHNGTGFATDRFKRVHELAVHCYRGSWGEIYHDTPRVPATAKRGGPGGMLHRYKQIAHTGQIAESSYADDGLRLARSVAKHPSVRGGIHPTEKPVRILEDFIHYGCPLTGVVLDPFAGSGSTLEAARRLGRRAIGVEAREEQCEKTANRLSQGVLDFGEVS